MWLLNANKELCPTNSVSIKCSSAALLTVHSPHVPSQVAPAVELPLTLVALQLGGAVHGAHVVGDVRASAKPSRKCFIVG